MKLLLQCERLLDENVMACHRNGEYARWGDENDSLVVFFLECTLLIIHNQQQETLEPVSA